ncbi:MAG: Asp-tRNA(Asn)/Glu-tRNA(Gln) amidotransferase subunit GatB [Candidatus Taylorbacteria bacterium]|nr:Asp-tRNA(Asn)/Glu-tRNA(Gln) amidotransferase subunit GatB [Candidatus Taylorbacteria bacterium]
MKDYLATIGLEIHAELKTSSKMFCSCKNDPDEEKPNTNICPVCTGHPGTLPVLNKEAIKHVLKIGHSVGGRIADFTEWDRKNYFYPDIPKGYQISQYKYPLVSGGKLAGVELTRIHLEEDTAQSTHDTHHKSLINFNRSGVPLMELVTEPVIHDAETAVKFAKELQLLLRYIGAGEANLEKGEMRVEANISVSTTDKFGIKTEVKNLNSFKAVEKAIDYEIKRQVALLEKGEGVVQETRGFDENTGTTYSQRLKESSHDYRYFPEPDLPKLKISEIKEFSREELVADMPELPWIKRDRLIRDFSMTEKEVAVLVENSLVGKYFEEVIKDDKKISKLAMNYIINTPVPVSKINPANFAKLMKMICEKKLSSRGAKDMLILMLNDDADPEIIAEKNNLLQKSDEGEIKKIVLDIVTKNQLVVVEYKSGKEEVLQFLIGQGMKATKGSANPELLKKLIVESISSL